jgi:hypothetical protein
MNEELKEKRPMEYLLLIVQLIVGLGILNVWLIRRNRPTPFRGGLKSNMQEEFSHYGLPSWSVWPVGVSKVFLAFMILGGVYLPALTAVGALGLGLFMLGAVVMHLKVRDTFLQTLPALFMLAMCLLLALGSSPSAFTTLAQM